MDAAGKRLKGLWMRGCLRASHLSMATNGMCASQAFIDTVNRHDIRFASAWTVPRKSTISIGSRGAAKVVIKNKREHFETASCDRVSKGIAITYSANHSANHSRCGDIICRLRDDLGIWTCCHAGNKQPATPVNGSPARRTGSLH